jgi:hypothetical protein
MNYTFITLKNDQVNIKSIDKNATVYDFDMKSVNTTTDKNNNLLIIKKDVVINHCKLIIHGSFIVNSESDIETLYLKYGFNNIGNYLSGEYCLIAIETSSKLSANMLVGCLTDFMGIYPIFCSDDLSIITTDEKKNLPKLTASGYNMYSILGDRIVKSKGLYNDIILPLFRNTKSKKNKNTILKYFAKKHRVFLYPDDDSVDSDSESDEKKEDTNVDEKEISETYIKLLEQCIINRINYLQNKQIAVFKYDSNNIFDKMLHECFKNLSIDVTILSEFNEKYIIFSSLGCDWLINHVTEDNLIKSFASNYDKLKYKSNIIYPFLDKSIVQYIMSVPLHKRTTKNIFSS